MLSGLLVMGQAAFLDGQVFNLSPSLNDDVVPAEVGIGRRDVAEALVVTAVVVGLIFSPLGCQIPGDKTSVQAALISNTADA